MDLEKQYLAEYGHLRQEILDADKANYQVLGFLLAATGLLFARAFELPNPAQGALTLAIVQVFAFPCHLLLRANRRRVWRIATYLRTFVEPRLPGLQWESRLHGLRLAGGSPSRSRYSTHVVSTESLTLLLISCAAIVAEAMIFACKPQSLDDLERGTSVAVFLVNLGAAAYYHYDRQHGVSVGTDSATFYTGGWEKVRERETPGAPGATETADTAETAAASETEPAARRRPPAVPKRAE